MADEIKKENQSENFRTALYKGRIIRLVVQAILGLGLLIDGLVLLSLRIAVWSLLLGLPMVIVAVVFIIFTYDDAFDTLDYSGDYKDSEKGK